MAVDNKQALADLQTSQAALSKAVTDVAAELKSLAAQLTTPGVSPADVETAAQGITAQAAALEAAVQNPAGN